MKLQLALALAASLLVSSCGDDHGTGTPSLVTLDGASDEALDVLLDYEADGLITVNDTQAPIVTAPADGAAVPAATPPTFTWSRGATRHGTTTGDFVWLRLEGPGMAGPVDVLALTSTSWTPDTASWDLIKVATGPVTVKAVYAYMNALTVEQGPFEPTTDPTFTITN